jgi:hypothetical protein
MMVLVASWDVAPGSSYSRYYNKPVCIASNRFIMLHSPFILSVSSSLCQLLHIIEELVVLLESTNSITTSSSLP